MVPQIQAVILSYPLFNVHTLGKLAVWGSSDSGVLDH